MHFFGELFHLEMFFPEMYSRGQKTILIEEATYFVYNCLFMQLL